MNSNDEIAPGNIGTRPATCEPLQVGGEYRVDSVPPGTGALTLSCTWAAQRIWSRVGSAHPVATDGATRYFLKQNIDRSGQAHPEHWNEEREGAELGAAVLGAAATIPRPLFMRQDLLLNVFEFVDVVSMDVLLRDAPSQFERCFDPVLQRCAAVLEKLTSIPVQAQTARLARKVRPYDTGRTAILFRGLEIRNLGPALRPDGSPDPGALVVFDLGQASIGPLEDAGARMFVSVGLLNWGRPVSRFLRGPDSELMGLACRALQPYLSRAAVHAEIDRQARQRTQEILATGRVEYLLKRVGVDAMGRRYFRALSNWVEKYCG